MSIECCPTCGYDKAPEWLDEEGRPIVCPDWFHVPARAYWAFGDIVRVDPKANPKVPQPDDRRWMVLTTAHTAANRQWTILPMSGEPIVSHWNSMYGFERVNE